MGRAPIDFYNRRRAVLKLYTKQKNGEIQNISVFVIYLNYLNYLKFTCNLRERSYLYAGVFNSVLIISSEYSDDLQRVYHVLDLRGKRDGFVHYDFHVPSGYAV